MAIEDSGIISQGEVESTMQPQQEQRRIQASPSIGRQTSIYSLTLDEFQQSLSEKGRNFGSMNMDEFLNSIWTAEENQATNTEATSTTANDNNINGKQNLLQESNVSTAKGIPKQTNLPRQGSLEIPQPLCQKTVDEVWSDIHKNQRQNISDTRVQNPRSTQGQPIFGEMTLEDFLVKAGVVREQNRPQVQPQQKQYGMYPNRDYVVESSFVTQPVMGMSGENSGCNAIDANVATYQAVPQSGVGDPPGYRGGTKRGVKYAPQPLTVYGGKTGNSSVGGYAQVQGMGMGMGMEMGSPVSPVSSDRLCTNQIEKSNPYGSDISGIKGGRKRSIESQVERVVERRHRRMIKNRESAARSRARKQAYTVELEVELKHLKEENAHLLQALAKLERKRKQQYFEESRMKEHAQTKAQKTSRKLRRSMSCSY